VVYEEIELRSFMIFPYKLIDLTHVLDGAIPTWNGGCGFNHDVHIDYSDCTSEDKFRVMKVKMHAGIGTHMDAPSHCISGGKFIHDFDVNDLIMSCVVIDVSDQCHERYSLSAQDVADFESKYGKIADGSCVMVKTGWSKFWHTPSKYHNNHVFPSVSSEAASLLLERGVNALGIDTLSPDRSEDGFKVHKTFLGADKIIIENVANLGSMPPTGGFVMVLPIKIKDGTEAPVRLVGLVENDNGANR
jgi:kynurenine formamidase